MRKSKVARIVGLITGAEKVPGEMPYYFAARARDAMRRKDRARRVEGVRAALRRWKVVVTELPDGGGVSIRRTDTGEEIIL